MQIIGYVTVESVIASPLAVSGVTNAPFVTTAVFQIAPAPPAAAANIFRRTDGTIVAVTDEGEQVQIAAGASDG